MIETGKLTEAANVVVAVNTLLYALEDTLDGIVKRAQQHVDTTTVELADRLADPVTRAFVVSDVNLPGDGQAEPLNWAGVERAIRAVTDTIDKHESVLASVTDRATASVGAHVEAIIPTQSDLLGALASAFGNLINGLLGSLAEVPDFWTELYTTLRDAFSQDQDPLGAAISNVIRAMSNNAIANGLSVADLPEALQGTPKSSLPTGPQTVEQYMEQWKNQPALVRAFLNIVSMIPTVFALAGAMNASLVSGVTQTALAEGVNIPLTAAELVNLLRRGDIGESFAKAMATRTGVGPEIFDLKYRLTERLLDATPILEYWRRTGDDSVLDILKQQGYSDDDIAKLRVLALSVPTASDVVRFLARDVFDPAAIQTGGLDQDFEQKYREDVFNAAGVTKDTARLYWMAHWSLPSPTMGYEMLHRGLLDKAGLEDLLKLADYAPGWVDRLVAISYDVPGRIDVRRMWETGVIADRAELVRRYQDMGYSPADADTLATFTERLTEKSRADDAERTSAPLVRAIVQQYGHAATDYDTAHGLLTDLGLTDNRATYVLQQGIFERAQDREQRIRDAIKRDYVKGFLSVDDAVSRLSGYGFGDAEIASLFEVWNLDRELAEWSEERRHERDLSKGEVLRAYHERLETAADTAAGLARLGYDSDEIQTLIRLEDARVTDAENKLTEAALHTGYVTRRTDAAATTEALRGLGYSPARIAALMTRWSIEAEEKRPDLSASQLEKMLLQGIVPEDRIEALLVQRGYAPEHIALLMTLWGTEKVVQADALTEKIREFDIREKRLGDQGAQRIGLQSRGLDIKQSEFSQSQQALQARFTAAQQQTRDLQQQRLDAAAASSAARIAAQTARDAESFQQARERQAATLEAQSKRLDTQILAANTRAAASLAERDKALAQQNALQQRASNQQDQRLSVTLQAQAARQQATIDAANKRAAAAQAHADTLAKQRADAAAALADQRAHIQAARDVQLNAERIAQEGRAELARIRTETRASARKEITAADAAANSSAMQSLALQQTAAVANVNAQFAALQAQLTTQRQQALLAAKLAAETALANATPTATLLGTAGQ